MQPTIIPNIIHDTRFGPINTFFNITDRDNMHVEHGWSEQFSSVGVYEKSPPSNLAEQYTIQADTNRQQPKL